MEQLTEQQIAILNYALYNDGAIRLVNLKDHVKGKESSLTMDMVFLESKGYLREGIMGDERVVGWRYLTKKGADYLSQ